MTDLDMADFDMADIDMANLDMMDRKWQVDRNSQYLQTLHADRDRI